MSADFEARATQRHIAATEGQVNQLTSMLQEAESRCKKAEQRIRELESQGNTGDASLGKAGIIPHGLEGPHGRDMTFSDLPGAPLSDEPLCAVDSAIILVGGHRVKPSAHIAKNRFANQQDVLVAKRMVRVEVFVWFASFPCRKPYFTVYWSNSRTIGDLRSELIKTLEDQTLDISIVDASGRILADQEGISCTVTESGKSDDCGWVLCQLKMAAKENANSEEGIDELVQALQLACEKLPRCEMGDEEGDDKSSSEDEDGYCDQSDASDSEFENHTRSSEIVVEKGSKALNESAMRLKKMYQSADTEAKEVLEVDSDTCDFFDGPAGTKIPKFRHFYCKLPADEKCNIPDRVASTHALHTLKNSFMGMGLEHESEWRRLPHHFHYELQGIIEGMDPLDADLPDKLSKCLNAMKEGVSTLAGMEPFVPLDYKARIKELNDHLHEHRKQMLQCESDGDGDEDSEALREKLRESLLGFDAIFKELAVKHNEALGRTEALKQVEVDGKKFETSLKQVKDLQTEAKDQLAAEKAKQKQALQTQDEADEFQVQVEKQMTWSLALNRFAQSAAQKERDRLDEEIKSLQLRRSKANALVNQHRARRKQILEVARKSRLSYLHVCQKQLAISSAVKTRIARAKSQVGVLETSLNSLERLQAQYAQSLKTAREVSEEQRLDAGIDSFEAYCGSRKFHHIDYCNKNDALEMESNALKEIEKDKKKLEVTAKRLRTDRAKEELKRASEKYEEQATQYESCKTEVEALETTKAEHLELIEPVFRCMKQPHAAAVGASASLDELYQKALTLEYPTKWEQDYENEANQFESQIEEEVEQRWESSARRRIAGGE